MNDQQIKNSIKVWWEKAFRESDKSSKFLFLWMCFNAWLKYESGEKTDRAMLKWLKQQNRQSSELVDCFESCKTKNTFVDSLKFLAMNSPYKNSRGIGQDIIVKNENDFENIVEAIYIVRCNLSHGGSDLNDYMTQKQITFAQNILNDWIATLNGRING